MMRLSTLSVSAVVMSAVLMSSVLTSAVTDSASPAPSSMGVLCGAWSCSHGSSTPLGDARREHAGVLVADRLIGWDERDENASLLNGVGRCEEVAGEGGWE